MSVSSVTCPPTPGSVRSAPWTEETDELGRGELTNSLSTRSLPPLPNCRCAGRPPPRQRVSQAATPEGLPSRLLSFSSTAPLFLSQPFS